MHIPAFALRTTSAHLMAHYYCKVCERKPVLKIPSGLIAILCGLVVAAGGSTYNKGCRKVRHRAKDSRHTIW